MLSMNSEGARMLRNFNSNNVERQIAITLDNIVYVHPRVENPAEDGIASIPVNITEEEAAHRWIDVHSRNFAEFYKYF